MELFPFLRVVAEWLPAFGTFHPSVSTVSGIDPWLADVWRSGRRRPAGWLRRAEVCAREGRDTPCTLPVLPRILTAADDTHPQPCPCSDSEHSPPATRLIDPTSRQTVSTTSDSGEPNLGVGLYFPATKF